MRALPELRLRGANASLPLASLSQPGHGNVVTLTSLDTRAIAEPPPKNGERFRVAFVNTHPIQYFAPLYARLAHWGIDVTALYLSDFSLRGDHDRGFGQSVKWDIDLLAGYTPKFMGEAASRRRLGGFLSMVVPELWPAIRDGRFDAVVIHGHFLAAHHVALAAALAAGTPVFARAETHLGLRRAAWKETVRTPLMRAFYLAFDGFLAIGSGNARYFEAMGVPKEKIFSMPYTVDNDRFIAAAQTSSQAAVRAATRARLGIAGDGAAILYAAKFEPRKRPDDLIAAFAMLQREGLSANLVMVGSGELEAKLRAMVKEGDIKNVSFPGFVTQSELPQVYAASDVFVLPSENEPWGLAVNEAMCAGLPIVLSSEIGCAEDLVANGMNGATFKAGDVGGLAAALRPLIKDPNHRADAGKASLDRISHWGYREDAEGLRAAIETVRARRQGRASP
jgi:glycosyltransferase involved in cell wall biosynthesis